MTEITLAVLPFTCTAEPELGEGIGDEIHHTLTWLQNVQLPPAVDAMTFRDGDRHMKEAASLLSVRYILTGAVTRTADAIRLESKLHDTQTDTVLHENREDVIPSELGSAIDRVLHNVAGALGVLPAVTEMLTVKKGWSENPDVYIDYLKGLGHYRKVGAENNLLALRQFENALKKDKRFAKGWARLAECHAKHYLYHDAGDNTRIDKAMKAASNAVSLAPSFARPLAVLGLARTNKRDFIGAEDAFAEAIRLHPKLFDAWFWRAQAALEQGLLKKAIEYFEKASEVLPHDYQAPLLLRQVYMSAGRPEDAQRSAIKGIHLAKEHLKMNARDARAIYLVAGSLFQIGQYTEALQWADRALEVDPDDPMINYNVACCFAQAGEADKALDCLEKLKSSAAVSAAWMKNDSDLFSLHDHPRFRALLAELKKTA